ncbi:MAG: hypothetical protein ACREOG_06970 [Gemmatimonadaceae bacterium]
MSQVFILSPARLDGKRAKMLFSPRARFPLALAIRGASGAPLGEVFSFLSGLYFRGKLAYATAFANPPHRAPPALIITTRRGLWSPGEYVRRDDLTAFSDVDLANADDRFRMPLRDDAEALRKRLSEHSQIVLLGSIATGKYVDPLLEVFGERLVFPIDFVGRGDMSRGGLLLRCAREGRELDYAPVAGAMRRGARPPKLEPLRR